MQHYEQLTGAKGRQMFYRAERYRARDLFRGLLPEVEIDHAPYTLHDVSMSGLSVQASRNANWTAEVGAEVPVELRLGDSILHRGRGRVARVEQSTLGAKVALNLTSGYLDLPKMLAKHQDFSLRREIEQGLENAVERVNPAYRLLCADVVHLLRRYKSVIERTFGEADNAAASDEQRLADMLALCEERMLPEWRTLWTRANELVRPIMGDEEALQATKKFTELTVTPELMAGPIWNRSYNKPLGYPGDFEIMKYVYAWRRQGDTAYGKLLHRVGLDVAECIATRMEMVQRMIAEIVAAEPGGRTVNITNLGAGPAQEVANYLRLRTLPRDTHFTLVDQDHGALSYAYNQTYPEVIRLGGQASLNCLHASFSQLMKAGEMFKKLPPQDMIYSVGLVDYFTQRRARLLTASLYEQLAPGGQLVIGNMHDTPHGNLWPMEFLCDWNIVYRTEAEMRDMAADIPGASIEVKQDPTGRVVLLCARKP